MHIYLFRHSAILELPASHGLISPDQCMQVLKLVKKAAKRKQVKRGVKEVIKAIRKKTAG